MVCNFVLPCLVPVNFQNLLRRIQKIKRLSMGRRDSTRGEAFALHMATLVQVPSPHGPQSTARCDPWVQSYEYALSIINVVPKPKIAKQKGSREHLAKSVGTSGIKSSEQTEPTTISISSQITCAYSFGMLQSWVFALEVAHQNDVLAFSTASYLSRACNYLDSAWFGLSHFCIFVNMSSCFYTLCFPIK